MHMKKKAFKKFLLIGLPLMLVMAACDYEFIDPVETEVPDQVSFSNDVMPIFNQSCNMSGCHVEGHPAVDLSPGNAYGDISDKNLVDVQNPQQSRLYSILVESGSSHGGRSTPGQQAIILKWIKQGAPDN